MRRYAALALLLLGVSIDIHAASREHGETHVASSPDGRIAVTVALDAAGKPSYQVIFDGEVLLQPSQLGLVRDDADLSRDLRLDSVSKEMQITDRYTLLTNKRRDSVYVANAATVQLQAKNGARLAVTFQVSNDGVAFRYAMPLGPKDRANAIHRIVDERSSFHFLPTTQAWLQPVAVAKSGWKEVNPSYEEIYEQEIEMGAPPPTGAGWVFPALFRTKTNGKDVWLLVSESTLPSNYCGSRLQSAWRSSDYKIAFPDALEGMNGGPVKPESSLPWQTPWRFVVIGSLQTIVESTLGTDLAEKPASNRVFADGPGKASWSWPLLGDALTNFETQKQFIDYAAQMRWQYTLVDALWDVQIGYDKLAELSSYAASKGVRLLVWYNSAGDWNQAPQTPRGRMLTHESRRAEFDRIRKLGIAGVKVDFFGGDGQSVVRYYREILDDALAAGLLVNFHGATLPRGWQRTYPNLMTTEAVRGLEFVTFQQKNAEDEPQHAAMLPFTRNVFDPMDFTPMVLDKINNIERRTTSAFELALPVLFTSGIQHFAEVPSGMAKAPDYVRDFLRRLPNSWDDVKFVAGFPGKYVVIARRNGTKWYVAGINADTTAVDWKLPLSALRVREGTLIRNGTDALGFETKSVVLDGRGELSVQLPPRGGFVAEFDIVATN